MAAHSNGQLVVYDKEKEDAPVTPEPGSFIEQTTKPTGRQPMQVLKSVNSRNQKTNPVSVWRLSGQKIYQFAFSPDRRHLAVVLEDGSLRVMDYLKEEYVLVHSIQLNDLLTQSTESWTSSVVTTVD